MRPQHGASPKKGKQQSTIKEEEALAKQLAAQKTLPITTEKYLQPLRLRSIKRKEALAAAMTTSVGAAQAGRKSKAGNGHLQKRHMRRFEGERAAQLLKRVSTQVFFALQAHINRVEAAKGKAKTKAVEVEAMHLVYGKKHFIFVAANETDSSQYFKDIIGSTAADIQTLLTTDYKPSRDVEGKRRSTRYSAKLASSLFAGKKVDIKGTNPQDVKRAKKIAHQLKQPWSVLDLNSRMHQKLADLMANSKGGVYCLDISKSLYKERHAEELLVDVAEYIAQLATVEDVAVETEVRGKKRPCASCSGRMTDTIDKFGQNPGLLWMHAAGRQEAKVAKRTYKTVLTQQSCVTVDGRSRNAPHYDTASDNTDDELVEHAQQALPRCRQ